MERTELLLCNRKKIELTDSNKNIRVDSKKGSKFKDDTASNMSDSI